MVGIYDSGKREHVMWNLLRIKKEVNNKEQRAIVNQRRGEGEGGGERKICFDANSAFLFVVFFIVNEIHRLYSSFVF